MEELDLKELFGIFWKRKLQIILIILIFIVLGVIYTVAFTTPMYSSSTSLVLASSNSNQKTNTITATDITVNSKLVSTYSELVKSKNVLSQVKENLNIDVNEDSLRNNVTVSSVKDTELIKITVTTKEPNYSAKIANEIAKVFTEKVKEFYNIDNVQVVDQAEVSNVPSNINHKKDVIIFAFIGVAVAVVYVLIANMLDTTIKTAEDIEKEFKLPVIASIPIYNAEPQRRNGGKR
jgi:capsular polysaccharide biosynthesis protein